MRVILKTQGQQWELSTEIFSEKDVADVVEVVATILAEADSWSYKLVSGAWLILGKRALTEATVMVVPD
jgi:hypothetical protein